MNKIFTIGHSTDSVDFFFSLLMNNGVDTVVDVRSVPYSRFASQFSKDLLSVFLKNKNINYIPMGNQLGARYEDKELLFADGKVDFSKVVKTKLFQSGIIRIETGIEKGLKIALMCSEKNPLECHRFSLISHYLHEKKYTINHIVNESVFNHENLEEKLLDYYKENRKISLDINKIKNFHIIQSTLFDLNEINENELYLEINKLVAYNPMSTKEEIV